MLEKSAVKTSPIRAIYWFSFYDLRSPSVRYRAFFPLKHIHQQFGIGYKLVYPGYSLSRISNFIFSWVAALLDDPGTSIIVIQKVKSNFIYANLLKLLVVLKPQNVVYDTDDADFLEHDPRTINFFLRRCTYVSAGSEALMNYCTGYNNNTVLNTSPVPESLYVKKERNQEFTVGWIGDFGGGHKQSLQEQVFSILPDVKFKMKLILIGVTGETDRRWLLEKFEGIKNIQLELPVIDDWTNENEIQNIIAGFDVGIATLLNEQLHQCKSAFKLKQYMNAGIPVVSTDLPENNKFIRDAINGFLCESPSDFLAALERIHRMTDEEYLKFSLNASSTVAQFDLEQYGNILINKVHCPIPIQSNLQ